MRRLSVEAQLPATTHALGFLLTYIIAKDSQMNFFWVMFHSKVYITSLLGGSVQHVTRLMSAVLNFRTTLKTMTEHSVDPGAYQVSSAYPTTPHVRLNPCRTG